ncbi:unnamed protein product [Effrenium voratum]|uniref:CHORD domain-containing protein n=1 Tax=Effrenium voratum TaxID=2562239 RepID=A0AA36JDU0_9DINO|nr:unnamed protein product [Effrenium voratum]
MDVDTTLLAWLLLALLLVALVAGIKAALRPARSGPIASRLLREIPPEPKPQAAEAAPVEPSVPAEAEPELMRPGGRFKLSELPDPRDAEEAVWEVQSAEDAAHLLAGCQKDTVVACLFFRPFDGTSSRARRCCQHLAALQPAGVAFAEVNLAEAKDVAAWAKVTEPEARLLQPDGAVLERLRLADGSVAALEGAVLARAAALAKQAPQKLAELGMRYPDALHHELVLCMPKEGPEKMEAAARELMAQRGEGAAEAVLALCRACASGAPKPKPRQVAALARAMAAAPAVPLLDLSRRLAGLRLLGGSEPGAREALGLLLESILLGVEKEPLGAATMLALQCLANSFHQSSLGEALLPVAVEFTRTQAWHALWSGGPHTAGEDKAAKAWDAGAALLLNASVALQGASFRVSLAPLLEEALQALHRCPEHPRLNWAVGNFLAMDAADAKEDAKRALQAQPLPPLRQLAAAVFHGTLEAPETAAFPAAWRPASAAGGAENAAGAEGAANAARRRPGAIPARYRRRGGCARMKVTLKYEEASTEDLHMTLRLTLPAKYVNGTNREIVKLFVDHYNKKNGASPISVEDLHLKIVGGVHLDNEERVRESLTSGDECYLLGKNSEGPPAKPVQGYSAPVQPVESKVAKEKDKDGKMRCKNFGCQKMFDPDGPPQECQHHKSAPIFHETAKWWSCCPDNKAYDFDEFMKIPGCNQGFCTNESQAKKRFLGGTDLRADSAPVRLDANAPPDPREKLAAMRKGLVAVGVDGALFEQAAMKIATGSDLEKVCDVLKGRFSAALKGL